MKNQGLVYIFTGDGKGKTSAALGTAMRALAAGWRVGWIAFYKEAGWNLAEQQLETMLRPEWAGRFELKLLGKGFYIKKPGRSVEIGNRTVNLAKVRQTYVSDDDTLDSHQKAAGLALAEAIRMLARKRKRPQVLVLDEVANAVADGLIDEPDLINLIGSRQSTHLVLTGRNASQSLQDKADLVSRIEKVKHPYDAGQLAVKGLDF
jgi:cob(I)alamin adenosyltransferase